MLFKVSNTINSWAKGMVILMLLVFFASFVAITVPFLQNEPGGNIVSLDARMFYTPDEAYTTVESYSGASQFWIRTYLTWDIVNPVIYTLIFSLGISWLFQRSFSPDSKLQLLNLTPVGAGLFDLFENFFIVILLIAYPAPLTGVAWLATFSTICKTIFLGISTILILIGVLGTILKMFKKALTDG